jgi:hypothetical protein
MTSPLVAWHRPPFVGGADVGVDAGIIAAEIVPLVVTPVVFVSRGHLYRRPCPEGIHVGLNGAEVLTHLEGPAVHGRVPIIGHLLPVPLGPIAVLAGGLGVGRGVFQVLSRDSASAKSRAVGRRYLFGQQGQPGSIPRPLTGLREGCGHHHDRGVINREDVAFDDPAAGHTADGVSDVELEGVLEAGNRSGLAGAPNLEVLRPQRRQFLVNKPIRGIVDPRDS